MPGGASHSMSLCQYVTGTIMALLFICTSTVGTVGNVGTVGTVGTLVPPYETCRAAKINAELPLNCSKAVQFNCSLSAAEWETRLGCD